ncbi:MAG: hypothetical protein RR314_06520 [Oscillospiraceae bacterium]
MKKRAIALLLAFLIIFCAVPLQSAEAASDVCFIALNDSLPELSSYAYSQRSTVYVPYSVFETYRIYHSYYASGNIATLYTSSKQIYFDLSNGNTYDGEGNYYSTSAIFRGSTIYVSVSFVCLQFGLSWSYINGTDSGDICRINDGGASLSDSQFLSAASTLMAARYNAYLGITTPGTPGDKPSGDTPGERNGCDVYLSFQGMPSSALLDTLRIKGVSTCFFLTADEVQNAPDTVRRIVAEGHSLGVLCSGDPLAEYNETSALIFEAARISTLLIASSADEWDDACKKAADRNDLVFWDYTIDGVRGGAGVSYASYITAYLGFSYDRADVRILCCDATDRCISSLLSFIITNSYNLRELREVENPR